MPQGKFPSVGGSPRRVLEKRNQQPPALFDCMLPSRADARVSSAWRYSSVRARDKEETAEQDAAARGEEVAAADLAVDTEPAPGSLPITGSQVLGRSPRTLSPPKLLYTGNFTIISSKPMFHFKKLTCQLLHQLYQPSSQPAIRRPRGAARAPWLSFCAPPQRFAEAFSRGHLLDDLP